MLLLGYAIIETDPKEVWSGSALFTSQTVILSDKIIVKPTQLKCYKGIVQERICSMNNVKSVVATDKRGIHIQSALVISTSLISNNRSPRSEIWSLFKHENLTIGNKILWKRGDIAPQCNFSSFPQYFQYISNFRNPVTYSLVTVNVVFKVYFLLEVRITRRILERVPWTSR